MCVLFSFCLFSPRFLPPHYFPPEGRVADMFLLLCNYFILFFMGTVDREIMCQLLGLAHKAEMRVQRWEYQFDGVEARLVPILAPLTCFSNAPSSHSKA